ncbi:MAG: hypothetical protein IJC06_01380 [Clostridia bacterium]|nr:hypothetical protein [Clostridia bacterium]
MYTDMFGKTRMKINLHLHTSESDGWKFPEEAAEIYKNAGYDAVAITDHWKVSNSGTINGLRILSGVEYNINKSDSSVGVYHILGIGQKRQPSIADYPQAQPVIDEINRCGGIAVLAHPAWCLNTVEQMKKLRGISAVEIYNSVSDSHQSSRPYAGHFVDTCANSNMIFPLIAADDTHYYDEGDCTKSFIMLECDKDATDDQILSAIKAGKFYSSQGPEIHIIRDRNDIVINCTPSSRISLFSNLVWGEDYCIREKGVTQMRHRIAPDEKFIRAEVTDEHGNKAWSNIIKL